MTEGVGVVELKKMKLNSELQAKRNMKNSSENSKTEFLRLSFTLFLIAGIMAFLVALVNNITAPVISLQNSQKNALALQEVLPEANDFTSVYYPQKSVNDVEILGVYRSNNDVGYCS